MHVHGHTCTHMYVSEEHEAAAAAAAVPRHTERAKRTAPQCLGGRVGPGLGDRASFLRLVLDLASGLGAPGAGALTSGS